MARNPIKAKIKEELLKTYPEEVVRKGMARGERWMRAAYGAVDYQCWVDESGEDGVMMNMAIYCGEVAEGNNDQTFNKKTFGIYGNGRQR